VADIEYRLPSKIPYGYVNVKFTLEETPEPEILAAMYASYAMAFAEQERKSLDEYGKPVQARTAPSEATPEVAAPKPVHGVPADAEVSAEDLIKQELGGVVVSEEIHEKPWEQDVPAAAPKPWENGGSAPKAAAIDW